MKYIIIFALLLFPLTILAQQLPLKIYEYRNNGITIRAEVVERIYKYYDSVLVKISYINKSHKDIVIFNPSIHNSSFWNSEFNSYIFDLGGDFWIDLGRKQSVYLIRIPPQQEYIINIKKNMDCQNISKMKYGVMESWYDTENVFSSFLEFHIGYLITIPELQMEHLNVATPYLFNNDKKALIFEQKLNRVFIGPILIKVMN